MKPKAVGSLRRSGKGSPSRRHRRSLNNEAILCLDAGLARTPATLEQRLTTIRALRLGYLRHGQLDLDQTLALMQQADDLVIRQDEPISSDTVLRLAATSGWVCR